MGLQAGSHGVAASAAGRATHLSVVLVRVEDVLLLGDDPVDVVQEGNPHESLHEQHDLQAGTTRHNVSGALSAQAWRRHRVLATGVPLGYRWGSERRSGASRV